MVVKWQKQGVLGPREVGKVWSSGKDKVFEV